MNRTLTGRTITREPELQRFRGAKKFEAESVGHTIAQIDYSAMEMRIMQSLKEEEAEGMLEAFKQEFPQIAEYLKGPE